MGSDLVANELYVDIADSDTYQGAVDAVNAFVNHFQIFTEREAEQLVRALNYPQWINDQ